MVGEVPVHCNRDIIRALQIHSRSFGTEEGRILLHDGEEPAQQVSDSIRTPVAECFLLDGWGGFDLLRAFAEYQK